MRVALWLGCGWLFGCTCEAPRPVATAPEASHFGEWPALVWAAVRGDETAARVYARDLAHGPVDEGDGSAVVGAGLGFLQVAHAEELIEGIIEVGAGCASCHEERGVQSASPSWKHESAPAVIADALAFGRSPSVGSPVEAGTANDVVAACAACHATGRPESR